MHASANDQRKENRKETHHMKKFWNWARDEDTGERTLYLCGVIAETSWFDDDITPAMFKQDLLSGEGNITVWINSPGGDVRPDRALLEVA